MADIYEDDSLAQVEKEKTDALEDARLTQVEKEKTDALQEVKDTYSGMAEQAGEIYDKQAAEVQNYADKQSQLQQEQTDFTIEKIEQAKDQAQKDYTKEQSAAYTDYQKQTAQHGVQAEQMAAGGLAGTGYGESSRIATYNTYQNRVAAARESYAQLKMNYENAIKEARLQNSSVLAQIAYDALVKGLEISAQSLQYSQQLAIQELGAKQDVENAYHGRYMDILGQINTEKAQAEQIRQFDLGHNLDVQALEEQKAQNKQAQENWQKQYDYQEAQDKQAQENWQKQFDHNAEQDQKNQQLNAASMMATVGDFSGYKKALGLTDAQVKKLETEYQKNVKSEADEKAYAEKQQRAEILALTGDFSGYKELYGLTKEQTEALKAAYTQDPTYEPMSQGELQNWENRFALAKNDEELQNLVDLMIENRLNENVAYLLYEMYKKPTSGPSQRPNVPGALPYDVAHAKVGSLIEQRGW